jgi:hypothetical protein
MMTKNFCVCEGPVSECKFYDNEDEELACEHYEPGLNKRCRYYFNDGCCTNLDAQTGAKKK